MPQNQRSPRFVNESPTSHGNFARLRHGAEPREHHPEFHERAEQLELADRRIHHMRVAAENLVIAEMHELAREVMERAEGMERELHEAREQLEAEQHEERERHEEHGPEMVRELREEIKRLRSEVEELRDELRSVKRREELAEERTRIVAVGAGF